MGASGVRQWCAGGFPQVIMESEVGCQYHEQRVWLFYTITVALRS